MDLICQKSKRKFESKPKHKIEAVIIKIYTRILCTDVEYKTLSIDNKTTCKEIVQMILKKFRLQHRDSNLFYLTLEAWIKQTGKYYNRRIRYSFSMLASNNDNQ